MSWWGKALGGYFGFLLGGPLGALMGAALGHNFDRGTKSLGDDATAGISNERTQMAFFTASFSVMGHVAKADGTVSQSEIRHAEAVMQQMQLNAEMRTAAINLFNEGKKNEFDLEAVMAQFRQECNRKVNLQRMFVEIQIQAAYADGNMDPAEREVLVKISSLLGFPDFVFRQLEALVRSSMGMGGAGGGRQNAGMQLQDAYSVLAVDDSNSKAGIKKAYRRLMSQHHPDKLVAKGLPEEMIKLANEKTTEVRKAYEIIKSSKGW